MKMNDVHSYQISLRGTFDEADLNATSPVHIRPEGGDATVTLFSVRADQSAIIGFIRHLHDRGITLLALQLLPLSKDALQTDKSNTEEPQS